MKESICYKWVIFWYCPLVFEVWGAQARELRRCCHCCWSKKMNRVVWIQIYCLLSSHIWFFILSWHWYSWCLLCYQELLIEMIECSSVLYLYVLNYLSKSLSFFLSIFVVNEISLFCWIIFSCYLSSHESKEWMFFFVLVLSCCVFVCFIFILFGIILLREAFWPACIILKSLLCS